MSGLGHVKYKMNLEYLVWAGRKCSKIIIGQGGVGETCDLSKTLEQLDGAPTGQTWDNLEIKIMTVMDLTTE